MSANKLKQNIALRQLQIDDIEEVLLLAQSAIGDESRHTRFRLRYAQLDHIHQKFHDIHSAIIALLSVVEGSDLNAEKFLKSSFNESYFTIKTIYKNLFSDDDSESSVVSITKSSPNVKLPKISLPTFSGNYKDWTTFYDIFVSLVHNNDNLSDVEKFQYLLSSVTAQAFSLLKGISLTSENYQIAFNTLTKRYQNKRLLANSFWQELTNVPKLSQESVEGLRKLIDVFSENLSFLKNLGLPVDQWDFILFHMMMQKLDNSTIKRFELQECSTELPSFATLQNFLLNQCTALESAALSISAKSKYSPLSQNESKKPQKSTSIFLNQSMDNSTKNKLKCNYCQSAHSIYKCYSFLAKSPFERQQIAKMNKWCFNCLHSAHDVSKCASKSTCRSCSGKHHSLLHFPNSDSQAVEENSNSVISSATPSNSSGSSQAIIMTSSSDSGVLLATAQVKIRDAYGNFKMIRALLDSGSQTNLITKKCASQLGLHFSKSFLCIRGIGESSIPSSSSVICTVCPRSAPSPSFTFDALVMNKICSHLPSSRVSFSSPSISTLDLADPNFDTPGNIDLLLGAEVFPSLLLGGRVVGEKGEPSALQTVFGWVLMGRTVIPNQGVSSLHISVDSPLNSTLKAFWEVEELPNSECRSPEEVLCEEIFSRDVSRSASGRYIVSLPFKVTPPISFGDTYSMASRRFLSLERRLRTNPTLRDDYCKFMQDYLDSGHMTIVDLGSSLNDSYFIPHHCVVKPESSSTKLRVVFDASAKVMDNPSLNDCLLTGPKLQADIVTILLRFRIHKYVFTADIRQMYRQILVDPVHRKYQRILWRFSPSDPVKCYELNTVTYGVSSAPFLALRTLHKLADDEETSFSLAAKILRDDVYVDDVVSGSDDLQGSINLRDDLIALLGRGGFELRKWSSNNPCILEGIPDDHQLSQSFSFDEGDFVKILGLRWNPCSDCFSFAVTGIENNCTKRSILSQLARIYDPLGFLTPFTFLMKYFIQLLWVQGLQWDQVPSSEFVGHWSQCRSELSDLQELQISRRLSLSSRVRCELHGFGDASERGYAAVAYFRFLNTSGEVSISFICAKSKVAPVRRISLPRLELCASLLLAKLISFIKSTYSSININDIYAWSDSKVALAWIKSSPHKWKSFVSNRTTKIQDLVPPERWFHVRSEDNPADFGSRGLTPSKLVRCTMWWSGPSWLSSPAPFNLEVEFSGSDDPLCLAEAGKITLTTCIETTLVDDILSRFSTLSKIQNVLAYVLRFYFNSRYPSLRRRGCLTASELKNSLYLIVKTVQSQVFSDDILNLQSKKLVSKPLRKLNPFLDSDGILRVGGRIAFSGLSYENKHPALLPCHHLLTDLIIRYFHIRYLHPGHQMLQYLLCQQFWILSPRRAIHRVLAKCNTCFRVNPKPVQPLMGNLPAVRLNKVKPFQCVGVDFGGPFFVTMSRNRGAKYTKAYICLFICFAVKAVHVELVSDLSSEAFLAALRRFIARRGRCHRIFSDGGTNFRGAHGILLNLMKNAVESEKIEWTFNPPSSPHFGGLWEAGIKSTKTHLLRVIGEQKLTYEELYTVLTQIEAVLNSRPLCPLSSDPNDTSALTPGHFLTLAPLSSLPDEDLSDLPIGRLSRWQLLTRMHRDFWKRWQREYLHTLQQRKKWNESSNSPLKPGILVIVNDGPISPLRWRLARIEKLHPGSDGIARVATIRTVNGSLQRPVVKLCPLPEQ